MTPNLAGYLQDRATGPENQVFGFIRVMGYYALHLGSI
jgi:hypothetical protein